ncbi:cytochrome P450 6g1-like [Battus philenor]|uniref:cytochrome P450 6g1-like n=1 Tax=Battus philenor TaxID=42288 RepID=UPI0035CFA98B
MILLLLVLAAVWWWGARRHDYWRRRRVPYEWPLPFVGTEARVFLARRSVSQAASDVYWRHPTQRYVGTYRGNKPQLVVRDPDLAYQLLVADFNSFHSRGLHPCEDSVEPLLRNLFFAEGELWRALRRRLAPAFTIARLKAMFPLVAAVAERLAVRASDAAGRARPLDVRDLMARYNTDVIASCGFGIEADCLDDDNSAFKKLGRKIYRMTPQRCLTILLKCVFPRVFKSFKFLGQELEDEVVSLVRAIIKERNNEPSDRNDFVDLMLRLARHPREGEITVDDELVAAQCFVFFAAGFETSTTATSFTLHQLAHHPRAQDKAQKEVDSVLQKYGGKLCYEAVNEMTYLEWTLMEALRMFPPGLLLRKCTRRYTLPGTDVTLDSGVKILIPLEAIHNDPQYFEEPHEFMPERFRPARVAARNKRAYLPFGAGPRYCIGARLGMMQSLVGLAAVLSRSSVRPAPGAPRVLGAHPTSTVVQNLAGPVPLLLHKRGDV